MFKQSHKRRIRRSLLCACCICIALSAFSTSIQAQAAPTLAPYATRVTQLVNRSRTQQGALPLSALPVLCDAADERAQETIQLFSHTRPNGESCFTVLSEYGIPYGSAGENIAAGHASEAAVMEGWMNSEGHRANILSTKFAHIGVGYAQTGTSYRHYWTQLFIGGCTPQKLSVSQPDKVRSLSPGQTPADLNETLTVRCDAHGDSALPLTDDLCTGFNPNVSTVQTVTVAYRGMLAALRVQVGGQAAQVAGDLNGDGNATPADALLALQISLGILSPTQAQIRAGDVNGDNRVTPADALAILQYALGVIDGF